MTTPALAAGSAPAMRAEYTGTGGEMFGKLIVGFILTIVTVGIYSPWFAVGMYKYLYEKTSFGPTARGRVRFEFTGTGGQLFITGLVGMLLTNITLGLYAPWFICNLARFFADNSVGVAEDGTRFQMRFEGQGGQLFVAYLVGFLLTVVTAGIYMPWFLCKLQKLFAEQTRILENGQLAGGADFVGGGGDLFVVYLVGMILTVITLGIYASWFQCNMNRFFLRGTRWTLHGKTYSGDFSGTGGELFVINLVGMLLMMVTCGIYYFWFLTNLLKWNARSTEIRAV